MQYYQDIKYYYNVIINIKLIHRNMPYIVKSLQSYPNTV